MTFSTTFAHFLVEQITAGNRVRSKHAERGSRYKCDKVMSGPTVTKAPKSTALMVLCKPGPALQPSVAQLQRVTKVPAEPARLKQVDPESCRAWSSADKFNHPQPRITRSSSPTAKKRQLHCYASLSFFEKEQFLTLHEEVTMFQKLFAGTITAYQSQMDLRNSFSFESRTWTG